jgi:DNA repair exonuclease SbcCD ATPase subunit
MARILLTLTFALALLAGCGGDDDSGGGGGGDALTQEELVSQANKICRDGAAKIESKTSEIQEKIQNAEGAEEQQKAVADALEDLANEYDPYLEKLKDLNPPENLSADWDKFVTGIDDAFEKIPELADATRDGDREKLQSLTTDFQKIADDTRPFATKYKLDDCLPDNTTPTS